MNDSYPQILKINQLYPQLKFKIVIMTEKEQEQFKRSGDLPILMFHKPSATFALISDSKDIETDLNYLVDYMKDYDCTKLMNTEVLANE